MENNWSGRPGCSVVTVITELPRSLFVHRVAIMKRSQGVWSVLKGVCGYSVRSFGRAVLCI